MVPERISTIAVLLVSRMRSITTNNAFMCEYMTDKIYQPGCTAKAVSHQLTALRKEIESLKTGNFVSGAAGNGTPKGGASAKKRKTKDNSGDDVDDAGTPSKKSKTPKKSTTKTKAKKETNMDEEDEDVAARKDAADGREGEEEGDEDED